jgi:GDP-L-fucose synthase
LPFAQSDRIYVAGHRGLVGSALMRRLERGGYRNLVTRTHAELDLTDQAAVDVFFAREKPRHVLLAAARVGGIKANATYPAQFIHDNLAIEVNVIGASHRHGVEKLLFLGSSCIYPKNAPQPMKEEHLLTGKLEPTNESYAIAKIAGLKMCAAYNRQYGTDFICVMPTNLYGPGDNFDLETSHVLPALIRKIHDAKENGAREVVIWGSGEPLREFLHSDDLADACVHLMEHHRAADIGEFVNIGAGHEISIRELALLIAEIAGYRGRLIYDKSKPDGTPRKLLDVSRMAALGWTCRIGLHDGIETVYADYAAACAQRTAGAVSAATRG